MDAKIDTFPPSPSAPAGPVDVAAILVQGLGGAANIAAIAHCITRLRPTLIDNQLVNEQLLQSAGIAGILRLAGGGIQLIIGNQVRQVALETAKLAGLPISRN